MTQNLAEDDDTSISFTAEERETLAALAKERDQLGFQIRDLVSKEANVEDLGAKRRLDAAIRAKKYISCTLR